MSERGLKFKQFGSRIWERKRTAGKARQRKRKERVKRRKILMRKTFHEVDGQTDSRQQRDEQSKSSLLNRTIMTLKGFPNGSAVKESACNAGAAGNAGSIPGSGRSPGRGHGNSLQYSCLENPMDKGNCRATLHNKESNTTEATQHMTLKIQVTTQGCSQSVQLSILSSRSITGLIISQIWFPVSNISGK